MDLDKDKEYFYIAKEGLKAPLPSNWRPYKNSEGDIYYIDINTKKSVYEHPCDDFYKKLFLETKQKNYKKPDQKIEKDNIQFQLVNDSFSDNSIKVLENLKNNQNKTINNLEKKDDSNNIELEEEIKKDIYDYELKKEEDFKKNVDKIKKEKEIKKNELFLKFDSQTNELKNKSLKISNETIKKLKNDIKIKIKDEFQEKFKLSLNELIKKIENKKNSLEDKLETIKKEKFQNLEYIYNKQIDEKKKEIESIKCENTTQLLLNNTKIKLIEKNFIESHKNNIEVEYKEKIKEFEELEKEKMEKHISSVKLNLEKEIDELNYVIFNFKYFVINIIILHRK